MKCAKCVELGQRSKVYSDGTSRTLMGGSQRFWDEDGAYHYHEVNTDTTDYWCSEGHSWWVKSVSPCPNETCERHERDEKIGFRDKQEARIPWFVKS